MVSELFNKIADKLAHIDYVTWGLILGSALVCALIVYVRNVKDRSVRDFLGFMFPEEVMLHPSARADAMFWISKRLIMPFLLIPAGITFVSAVGFVTNRAISWAFGIQGPLIDGPPGPSILALEAMEEGSGSYRGPVVYLGTLSKSVVPGLRVGWMVAPADLVQTLALAKQSTDLSSSMLTHAIALDFMESGFEDIHVPRTVDVYRDRRDALLRAAGERLSPWFEWDTPPGGMFVWMRARKLPGLREIDTDSLYRFALEEKVAFVPSSVFDFDGNLRSAMRVNFTRSAPDVIQEGILRLSRAVERYLASNSDEASIRPDPRP